MHEKTIHLHRAAPLKLPEGQPCNGCGVCCALETCPAARMRFLQSHGPCAALEWTEVEQRYRCGLLSNPGAYLGWLPKIADNTARRLIARWIAAGEGCDCSADAQA